MKKRINVTNILVNIIFYPVVILLIIIGIMFAMGIRPYITMSGSMEPAIHTGSVCFVDTRAEYDEIIEGDIIAFYESPVGGYVTHRVIDITDEGFVTQGDANDVSDGVSTTRDNFHGKTLFSVPYAGYVIQWMKQPQNIAIMGIIVIGLFALNIIDSAAERKEKPRESE